jgi:SAM-dependent methyltransferase
MHALAEKILTIYKTETPWKATKHLLLGMRYRFFALRDEFDRFHRTNTGGRLQPWEVSNSDDAKFGVLYMPVSADVFQEAMRQLPIDRSTTTFVDLGSGKGRALILAHEYGFKSIIGVEYSARLIADARKNLHITGVSASLICQSAAEYRFPSCPLLVFLFNPFGPEVLRSVLQHLPESGVTVVYLTPLHADMFSDFPRLQKTYDTPHLKIWRSLRG